MTPILFVHGFGGGSYEFKPIESYLKKKGDFKFYEFVYPRRFGEESIKNIAQSLKKFVSNNIKEKKLAIIGISQGGIIAEYYLKNFNKKKIDCLITLCTPHKGSLAAYFRSIPGFLDLRPGSKTIIELDNYMRKSKIPLYSVFTPFDLMVIPGWNANPGYGRIKMVLAPLHPLAFWWPTALKFIYDSL
jgi:triacylglycerol lipase